jgi:predicted anti-sigma-YlaC factor YlaD
MEQTDRQTNQPDMDCGRCRESLVPWLEGLLGPGESCLCQAHLEACAACRDEYIALVQLQRQLARWGIQKRF